MAGSLLQQKPWFQRLDDRNNTPCTGSCNSCGKGAYDDDAPELCRECYLCATCCEKTKKENNGLCNEWEIAQAEEYALRQEKRERARKLQQERQCKADFVKERGTIQIGYCDHGHGWFFIPNATKDHPDTYICVCGASDRVEYLALLLGYYGREKADTKSA